jgi:hypothetical protein
MTFDASCSVPHAPASRTSAGWLVRLLFPTGPTGRWRIPPLGLDRILTIPTRETLLEDPPASPTTETTARRRRPRECGHTPTTIPCGPDVPDRSRLGLRSAGPEGRTVREGAATTGRMSWIERTNWLTRRRPSRGQLQRWTTDSASTGWTRWVEPNRGSVTIVAACLTI